MHALGDTWDKLQHAMYSDPALSDLGIAQIRQMTQKLKTRFGTPDEVLSSPLTRAIETAHYLFPEHRPVRVVPFIKALDAHRTEHDLPPSPMVQLEALTRRDAELKVDYRDVTDQAGAQWNHAAHQSNYQAFLKWLGSHLHPHRRRHTIVVVCHQTVMQQVFGNHVDPPPLSMAVQRFELSERRLVHHSKNPDVKSWTPHGTADGGAVHFAGIKVVPQVTHQDVARCDQKFDFFQHAPTHRVPWARVARYAHWLRDVPDTRPVRELVLPQTHDAATGYMVLKDKRTWAFSKVRHVPTWITRRLNHVNTIFKWTQTQNGTLADQVWGGARSLDLRVHVPTQGPLIFHHGHVIVQQRVLPALADLVTFLQQNPSEMLFLVFTFDRPLGNAATAWDHIVAELERLRQPIFRGNVNTATLGDLRGHVVLFCTQPVAHGSQGELLTTYKIPAGDACSGPVTAIARGWNDITSRYLPCAARPEDRVFVLQLHAQLDAKHVEHHLGSSSLKVAEEKVNPQVIKWLRQSRDRTGRLNVLELDGWTPSMTGTFLDLNGIV
jgi:broad specificity phosphatase PhoE